MGAERVLADLTQEEQIKALSAVRRGDVLKVSLAGAKGLEMRGPHFCVVVSNDILNENDRTVVVVPLTTHSGSHKVGEHEIELKAGDGGLDQDGAAIPHQVRTIFLGAERIISFHGRLTEKTMERIETMLQWVLGASDPGC